jgi:hypothetical protein
LGADHPRRHHPVSIGARRRSVVVGSATGLAIALVPTRSIAMASREPADGATACATRFAKVVPGMELSIRVDVARRRLAVMGGRDTVCTMRVAVAPPHELQYAGRRWRFATPIGKRVVRSRRPNPVWVPPDWHYAEVARSHRLALRRLPRVPLPVSGGRRLVVRDSMVAVVSPSGRIASLPPDEHLVFGDTLFIPPVGSVNRRVAGALGAYALDLGHGILMHGTPPDEPLQDVRTHGCIRLDAADLEWLYHHTAVGMLVTIH